MKSPYQLEATIGMEHFITNTAGTGGKLRTMPEDFCVEEIYNETEEDATGEYRQVGEIQSGLAPQYRQVGASPPVLLPQYTHFMLEKKNWETLRAIKALGKALGVSHKRFGYAGMKDRRAVTVQKVAAWRVEPEHLREVKIRDIRLYGFKKSEKRISLGDAAGNKFKITVRNLELDKTKIEENVTKTSGQLKDAGVPNYFGYQRFGIIRPNTHIVGKNLMREELKSAVMAYLGNACENEREEARKAREFIDETGDFKKALEIFPKSLNYERSMLSALSENPNDYAGALRRLPKKLRWMLVHSYQSFLFNKVLSKMIERGMNIKGEKIALFGYDSNFSGGAQGDIERAVLEGEDVKFEDFKHKSMPELSCRGFLRDAAIDAPLKFEVAEDEINSGRQKCTVEFQLLKGSYATVVLREFMKADPLNY